MRGQSMLRPQAARLGCASFSTASLARSPQPLRLHWRASTYKACTNGSNSHKRHLLFSSAIRLRSLNALSGNSACDTSPRNFSSTPAASNTKPPAPAQPAAPEPTGKEDVWTEADAPEPAPRRSRKPFLIHFALIFSIIGGAVYYTNETRKSRFTLNTERFMPCPVVSNEPIGEDAFLLTIQTPLTALVKTKDTVTNHHVIRDAWEHGLWSVEVKQPQLQIARNYTPLPPAPGEDLEMLPGAERQRVEGGLVQLRFYVRRYGGGEVSTYLSKLRRGDLVEIRGPHLGFDVGARLGPAGRELVFLAGGTGIAPAVQAATRLVDDVGVDVKILWANRSAADCAGCPRLAPPGAGGAAGFLPWRRQQAVEDGAYLDEEPSAVVRQLKELQVAYAIRGHTLDVRCTVDGEGRRVTARDVARAVEPTEDTRCRAGASPTCYLHSQGRLETSTDEGDAAGRAGAGEEVQRGPERRRCNCTGHGGAGRNLFMISGPDGFVSAYTGPKVWADGAERQGRVGGIVAELMRKDPETWKSWLVLKQ